MFQLQFYLNYISIGKEGHAPLHCFMLTKHGQDFLDMLYYY